MFFGAQIRSLLTQRRRKHLLIDTFKRLAKFSNYKTSNLEKVQLCTRSSYHSAWVNGMITSNSTADDCYKHILAGSCNASSGCGLPQPVVREGEKATQAQCQVYCRNTALSSLICRTSGPRQTLISRTS